MAVSHNGIHILNGRHLRSKRQYRNKLLEKLTRKIDRKKKGSRRTKRLASTNKRCRFVWHRNSAGACNIRKKYLGDTPVVGALAPTMGMRSYPHVRVAQREKAYRIKRSGNLFTDPMILATCWMRSPFPTLVPPNLRTRTFFLKGRMYSLSRMADSSLALTLH